MITYCLNTLTIFTDEVTDSIPENLYEDISDGKHYQKLSLGKLMPAVEGSSDFSEDWRIKNWGTWGVAGGSGGVERTLEDFLVINFETYETPPLPWVKFISSLYSQLTFDLDYLNIGNNTSGNYSFIAGVQIAGIHGEADLASWERFGYLESDFASLSEHAKKK